jgi:hypothetical protein
MSPKKPKDTEPDSRRGRRPGDPAAKRSDRLVVRVHPDLVDALNLSADEAGISRSLFIEKILVSYVRQDPRFADLDHMGRRRATHVQATETSMRAFEQRWNRFAGIRRAVIGDDIPDEGHYGPAGGFDDHGRAEDGSHVRAEPRPAVPQHMRKPKPAERILPHRGSRRRDRMKDDE